MGDVDGAGRDPEGELDRIEAEWARRSAGGPASIHNLPISLRNRILGALIGAPTWAQLEHRSGVDESSLRRDTLSAANQSRLLELFKIAFPGGEQLELTAFRAWKTPSRTPVRAFANWLRHNRRVKRVEVRGLERYAAGARLLGPDDRAGPALEFLRRSDLRNLMVVYQEGMTEGLRVLAAHLVDAAAQDPALAARDICYLSVGRDAQTHDRINFPRLVRDLHAFYCRDVSAAGEPIPADVETLRRLLTEIRSRMMTHPALLILDGHSALRGSLPNLRALVADDALTALLREILHPLLGHADTPQDPSRFYENRILVLADHDLPEWRPFAADALPLTHLSKARMAKVMEVQGRDNREALLAVYDDDRMKSDASLALADAIVALRRGRTDDVAALTAGLSTPEASYGILVRQLGHRRQFASLLALRLVAITDGGLRETTLVRLVDQWRKLAPAGWPEWLRPAALRLEEVAEALEPLAPLLFRGEDEQVAGLDDMNEPYVYLDDEVAVRWPDPRLQLRSFDLRSAALREAVIREFALSKHGEAGMALAHRILAEEALRQQTHIMRHAEWRGAADARYYRRLFQMVFHGYASLGTGEGAPISEAAPTVLPAKAISAYKRLHAVFFRTLLEHPPHFDMSKSLGRDRLKVEILRLAMNADVRPAEAWADLHAGKTDFRPRRPAYLAFDETSPPTQVLLALDQQLALARSAHQSHELDLAVQAADEATKTLDNPAARRLGAQLDEHRARLRKIRLDLDLLRPPPDLEGRVLGALRDAGFSKDHLSVLEGMQALPNAPPPADPGTVLRDAAEAFVEAHLEGVTSHQLAEWSDLLCRLGEARTISADESGQDRLLTRYRAFVTLYLAERIRREAFEREPLGRAFVVNGHSTRVLVRTALQLVRALARPESREQEVYFQRFPSARYFILAARRHLDLLTRYSARYPSERTSLLILEATFTRSVGEFASDKLLAALRLLDEADGLSFITPDRPRVRRRLILERAKVFRALASVAAKERGAAVRWWKLAVVDIVRLWRMTGTQAAPGAARSLWERAIAGQAQALWRMRSDQRYREAGLHGDDATALMEIAQSLPRP